MADDATRPTTPLDSVVLGYGPMLPLVAAGLAAWLLPRPWPFFAVQLGILWAVLILAFIGGVRRGYAFGRSEASTSAAVAASIAYFVLAGLALLIGRPSMALIPLLLGFALASLLDRRAALAGDAPLFFAALRPRQLLLGLVGLALLWAWTIAR